MVINSVVLATNAMTRSGMSPSNVKPATVSLLILRRRKPMSEMMGNHFCKKCNKKTAHMFSASGRKGVCLMCNNQLPYEEECDMNEVFMYSG